MKGIRTCCCMSDRVNYGWNESVSFVEPDGRRAAPSRHLAAILPCFDERGRVTNAAAHNTRQGARRSSSTPWSEKIPPPKLSLAILVTGPTIGQYQTDKIPVHQSCDGRRAYRGRRGKGERMLCVLKGAAIHVKGRDEKRSRDK